MLQNDVGTLLIAVGFQMSLYEDYPVYTLKHDNKWVLISQPFQVNI